MGQLCSITYKTMVLMYVCTCVSASISASARVTTNAVTECAPGVLVLQGRRAAFRALASMEGPVDRRVIPSFVTVLQPTWDSAVRH